jgi:formylglycine-generating enzyme required for sulfatase activity
VIGSPNHPIVYITWGDAARFANWLNNDQPTGTEGPATTETGTYTLNGAITDAALNAVTRNAGAKWFIPTESEWYKAAYYDPVAGHYWKYATGTDITPTSTNAGGTPNSANFYDGVTGYAVTTSTTKDPNQNYLTDVGAYRASASPYGTFDQSGEVFNWNEALINDSFRGLRGGSWASDKLLYLPSKGRYSTAPTTDVYNFAYGFRVAAVPEPSTGLLAILGCGLIWRSRGRFNV